MAERIVHVAHTCGCTLLRVGVSGPAHCPTHDRLTEALGSRWAYLARYHALAEHFGPPGGYARQMATTWLDEYDEGPRPSGLKGAR